MYWKNSFEFKIDQREFLIGFALTSTGSVHEKLKYVFRTYDHNKDGVINKKEMDRMIKVNILQIIFWNFEILIYILKQILMRLHAKDNLENTTRIIDELKKSLENLHDDKDLDNIKITSPEFVQLLANNKELCELLSPFNIE